MARLSLLFLACACFFVSTFFTVGALDAKKVKDRNLIYHPAGREGSLTKEQCSGACKFRCSETSHKKPCLFFCNYCCVRCLCVPSGTYGNKEECPCYNDMKTKEGKPKCP